MCNAYEVGKPLRPGNRVPWEALALAFLDGQPGLAGLVRPTNTGIVVTDAEGEIVPAAMRWGFVREFDGRAKPINNARSDKIVGRMWGKPWRERRRCLIPVREFYEWSGPKGRKQAHRIASEDGAWLWMGGLWEENSDPAIGLSYTMLTTEPNATMEPIHNRMPVIIPVEAGEEFLHSDDPRRLLEPYGGRLIVEACESPLKRR